MKRDGALGFYDMKSRRRLALLSASDGTPAIVFLDRSNPLGVLGGWYDHESTLTTMPKGSLPASLQGRLQALYKATPKK